MTDYEEQSKREEFISAVSAQLQESLTGHIGQFDVEQVQKSITTFCKEHGYPNVKVKHLGGDQFEVTVMEE